MLHTFCLINQYNIKSNHQRNNNNKIKSKWYIQNKYASNFQFIVQLLFCGVF